MRSFHCACGNRVYFENDRCLRCGSALAFDTERLQLRTVSADDRLCANHASLGTCNWLAKEPNVFCTACALNEIVPDLSEARRVSLYYQVEKAKRRLLYSLFSLGLPVEGRAERDQGLSFYILADARLDGVELDASADDAVITGHLEGRITINLLEADPHLRERMRMAMNESYRTLLGHFRHESGHYYWQRLVANGPSRNGWRELFGDERRPYRQSLDAYYRDGPPADWPSEYIGAYASCHPLEDFAECWAHYLHMADTLETAADAELNIGHRPIGRLNGARLPADFDDAAANWLKLAATMNDLNRSMGLDDAYPFSLPPRVVDKLRFIHELILDSAAIRQGPGPTGERRNTP